MGPAFRVCNEARDFVTVARSRPWKRIPHELPTALADIANNPNKKGYWDYSDTEEEL